METKLIRIGNSNGVIIPKQLVRKYQVESFTIVEDSGNIVLIPKKERTKSRQGWEAAFKKQTGVSAPEGDLFEGLTNQFDEEEWEW